MSSSGFRERGTSLPAWSRFQHEEIDMKYSIAILFAVLLSGCAVGPKYVRPPVSVPTQFRAAEPLPSPQAASLADLKWFEVFKDEQLQQLIRTALEQNYDLRDAAARVEAASAQLGELGRAHV